MTPAANPKPDAYTSIFDAPLDEYVVPDVGDADPVAPGLAMPVRRVRQKPPVLVVPFTRTITLGTIGKDVIGAKRAIWKADSLRVPILANQLFGPIALRKLREFQRSRGLVADGQLGPATLAKLAPFFDSYAFLLYAGYPPGGSKTQAIRNRIVAYAIWGYNHRVEIHYVMWRPMTHMDELEFLPVAEDCSAFATKDYKFGGAPDPNDLGYRGYGNTYEMRKHGRVVSIFQALPGDLVHYDGPQHVAVYVGHSRVVSHGSEGGPYLLPYNYRPVREIRSYLPDS